MNTVFEKTERKITNNVAGLKQKTDELAAPLKRLPWIEKLDHVVLKIAPLAPELALKVNNQGFTIRRGGTQFFLFSRILLYNLYKLDYRRPNMKKRDKKS